MVRILKNIFWVICFAFLVRACVVEPVRTSDDSMSPVVLNGDVVLVSKLAYGLRIPGAGSVVVDWHPVRRGDLVLVAGVGDPPLTLLRRVTAVPGDKIETKPGESQVLNQEEYLLAAEQKDGTMDSRQFGIVSRRVIVGKAEYIWLPADQNASGISQSKVKSEGQHRGILQQIL